MPRLVHHGDTTRHTQTGFGQRLYSANATMQGGRKTPSFLVARGTARASINATIRAQQVLPLCEARGAPVINVGRGDPLHAQLAKSNKKRRNKQQHPLYSYNKPRLKSALGLLQGGDHHA